MMRTWCQRWVTGLQMSGLLLTGDDNTYHKIIILLVYLAMWIWAWFCMYDSYHAAAFVWITPPVRKMKLDYALFPLEIKENAAWDWKLGDTCALGSVCKYAKLSEERREAKTCTATSSVLWPQLYSYRLIFTLQNDITVLNDWNDSRDFLKKGLLYRNNCACCWISKKIAANLLSLKCLVALIRLGDCFCLPPVPLSRAKSAPFRKFLGHIWAVITHQGASG